MTDPGSPAPPEADEGRGAAPPAGRGPQTGPLAPLLRIADAIALAALGLLLAVVAGNILGRGVFDLTGGALDGMIPGAIELARYALMILVFSALPRAATAGLVRVDLLIGRLPAALARPLERLWALLLAGFAGVCAWLLIAEAVLQAGRGDATQDLEMPLWFFTGLAGAASALLCLTGLWLALRRRS